MHKEKGLRASEEKGEREGERTSKGFYRGEGGREESLKIIIEREGID